MRRAWIPTRPHREIYHHLLEDVRELTDRDEAMREFFVELEHPAGGRFVVQHQPFTWNDERLPLTRSPLLGEHNEAILRDETGIDEERFLDLLTQQVIYWAWAPTPGARCGPI